MNLIRAMYIIAITAMRTHVICCSKQIVNVKRYRKT